MELSNLKKWRKVVPSILLAIVFTPILFFLVGLVPKELFPDGLLSEALKLGLILIFYPLGILYDHFQVRGFLNGASYLRINSYVEDQMRLTLQPLLTPDEYSRSPVGDRRWMRLLYRQVDSDQTLSENAKRIRENGIKWTTAADVALIFLPGGLILGLYASFAASPTTVYFALFLCFVGLLALMLISKLERAHLRLCQDQQEHIRLYLGSQLAADYRATFP